MRPRQTRLGALGSDEIPSTLAALIVDLDAEGGQELCWELAADENEHVVVGDDEGSATTIA